MPEEVKFYVISNRALLDVDRKFWRVSEEGFNLKGCISPEKGRPFTKAQLKNDHYLDFYRFNEYYNCCSSCR